MTPTSTENLRQMLDLLNENDASRWEVGFRNIVAILHGSRHTFEIKDVVEEVKALAPRHDDGTPAPEDDIAKCKRILAAVDVFHYEPTMQTRATLRKVIYDQLKKAKDATK